MYCYVNLFREINFIIIIINWERLNRSVAACVGRPSTATATAIWLHIAVAIENRCRGWGPLQNYYLVQFYPDCMERDRCSHPSPDAASYGRPWSSSSAPPPYALQIDNGILILKRFKLF